MNILQYAGHRMSDKHKLIQVSENSNIEFNTETLEMLLDISCKSIECDDFRANTCKMRLFLDEVDGESWQWTQTWVTPAKFFLHLIRSGETPEKDVLAMFEKLRSKWSCIGEENSCGCVFFDEMKKIKSALEDPSE